MTDREIIAPILVVLSISAIAIFGTASWVGNALCIFGAYRVGTELAYWSKK